MRLLRAFLIGSAFTRVLNTSTAKLLVVRRSTKQRHRSTSPGEYQLDAWCVISSESLPSLQVGGGNTFTGVCLFVCLFLSRMILKDMTGFSHSLDNMYTVDYGPEQEF